MRDEGRGTRAAGVSSCESRRTSAYCRTPRPAPRIPRPAMAKSYDSAYFHRWYRDPRTRVTSERVLERKVHLALSAAEYMLGRRVRTALDIGCGEARWLLALRKVRPGIQYTGVESSAYAVETFGGSRNIRQGSFGTLRALKLRGPFDLIVCADVLQYVSKEHLAPGLREIRRLLGGVAYVEA